MLTKGRQGSCFYTTTHEQGIAVPNPASGELGGSDEQGIQEQ